MTLEAKAYETDDSATKKKVGSFYKSFYETFTKKFRLTKGKTMLCLKWNPRLVFKKIHESHNMAHISQRIECNAIINICDIYNCESTNTVTIYENLFHVLQDSLFPLHCFASYLV